jgi:hypothetical protein
VLGSTRPDGSSLNATLADGTSMLDASSGSGDDSTLRAGRGRSRSRRVRDLRRHCPREGTTIRPKKRKNRTMTTRSSSSCSCSPPWAGFSISGDGTGPLPVVVGDAGDCPREGTTIRPKKRKNRTMTTTRASSRPTRSGSNRRPNRKSCGASPVPNRQRDPGRARFDPPGRFLVECHIGRVRRSGRIGR